MHGKDVLSGYLKDIKEQYQKKNIMIKAKITKKELLEIPGVIDVVAKADEYEVKIEDITKVKNVFKFITKKDNVTKFVVEEPSLNEIFVAKVGESYEK